MDNPKPDEVIKFIREKRKRRSNLSFILAICLLPLIFGVAYYIGKLEDSDKYFISNTIFPIIMFIIGITQIVISYYKYNLQNKVKNWMQINCTVIDKTLLQDYESAGNYGTPFKYVYPIIWFSYEFKDKKYISYRLFNGTTWTLFEKKIKRIFEKYQVNDSYLCYLDKNNPSIAVLEKKIFYGDIVFYLLAGIFFILTSFIIVMY